MVNEDAPQPTPWFDFDLFQLRETFYRVMLDKQVEILGLPIILEDEFTALRIRSEFADLKAKFCLATKPPPGYSAGTLARCILVKESSEPSLVADAGDTAPAGPALEEAEVAGQDEAEGLVGGFPEPVRLVAQDLINTHERIDGTHERIDNVEFKLRRENRLLNRKNERNAKRKKDLDEIKSTMHKKLHNAYIAAKFLLEDVKEEAIQGAPADWDLLGDPDVGSWEWDQGSINLHAIVKAVKGFAGISSEKFLELNVAEMANWQVAANYKSKKSKYLHTGLESDLEAFKEARKETRFDQVLARGRGRGRGTYKGNRGSRGPRRGGAPLRDGYKRSDGGSGSGGFRGKRRCHRCQAEDHILSDCPKPRQNNGP